MNHNKITDKIIKDPEPHRHYWSCSHIKVEWDPQSGGTANIEYAYLICSECGEVKKKKVSY